MIFLSKGWLFRDFDVSIRYLQVSVMQVAWIDEPIASCIRSRVTPQEQKPIRFCWKQLFDHTLSLFVRSLPCHSQSPSRPDWQHRLSFHTMRFGAKLHSSIYEPWRDSYLNYPKLKNLLYEGQSDEEWGERNESRFVEELDSELEKVPQLVSIADWF